MAQNKATDIQLKGKQELATPAEPTKPSVIFTPLVDIFETDHDITLLADMPGVATEDIAIDLRDGVLTLAGHVKPWESPAESDVLVEFEIGKYYRQFTLSEAIDQEKIRAGFKEGVLRLVMPKAAKAVPRKIAVTVS